MFQPLLVRKYLLSKAMPLLAAMAVLLCAAMVLVTWSVMNGFLNKLIASGRTTTGDVTISFPVQGFPHADELIKMLEKDPLVEAAAPMIEGYGLLGLPNGRTRTVFVRGVDGPQYARVTSFSDIIWWKPLDEPMPKDSDRADPRLKPDLQDDLRRYVANGQTLTRDDSAAVVLGIELSGLNDRNVAGFYHPLRALKMLPDGTSTQIDVFMPMNGEVVLTMLRADTKGLSAVGSVSRNFPVANEFNSGTFEIDRNVVIARMDAVQEMMGMSAGKRVATPAEVERMRKAGTLPPPEPTTAGDGGESFATGATASAPRYLIDDPARVTHVLVRGKGDLGVLGATTPLRERVEEIYAEFAAKHPGVVPSGGPVGAIDILTWEDQNRTMIQAVQKETGLVLFLFSMISLVAVVLVLTIFWSMIAEKTKDIGVMRALGASRSAVAGTWLLYGLAIGLVGSTLGVLLAYVIVRNINAIHDWMGATLGLKIWDPAVYYFTEIPSKVDPGKALAVFLAFIVACVVGALVPAVRAARMDPVRALRFE
jgi:lipoprotein-releasing system permease protein